MTMIGMSADIDLKFSEERLADLLSKRLEASGYTIERTNKPGGIRISVLAGNMENLLALVNQCYAESTAH